jgi:carboxypeptidase family protein
LQLTRGALSASAAAPYLGLVDRAAAAAHAPSQLKCGSLDRFYYPSSARSTSVKLQHHRGLLSGLAILWAACSPAAQLSLRPDPLYQSTQIVRLRSGVLKGQVRPLRSSGGRFSAMLRLMLPGKPDSILAAVLTDSGGHFRFRNVEAGRYRLVVLSIGFRKSEYTVVTADSGASSAVIGIKSDPFNLDEICSGTCPPQPSGVISGSILCAGRAGQVPPELEVTLADSASFALRALAPVQPSGQFEFSRVPLGAWRLEVNQRANVLAVLHLSLVRDTLNVADVRLTCR